MATQPIRLTRTLGWCRLISVSLALAASAAGAQELRLDPARSSVSFVGDAFLHRFRGEAKDISGRASLEPLAVPPVQKATLRFKMAALTTFNEERDQKMREWLQVAAQPEATFQLESVQLVTGDYQQASAQNPAKFSVKGTFALHGVAKPISGLASGWRENDRVFVSGDVIIDTLTFGLPQIRSS